MNDTTTAHAMLAMRLPERNILNNLSQILLATDKHIPSTYVSRTRQRYTSLCNQLRKIKLLGMS